MQMQIYATRNENSGLYDGLVLFRTDRHAQFELSKRIPPDQQAYTTLFCVGTYDIATSELTPLTPKPVPWKDVSVDELSDKTPVSSEPPHKQVVDFLNKTG